MDFETTQLTFGAPDPRTYLDFTGIDSVLTDWNDPWHPALRMARMAQMVLSQNRGPMGTQKITAFPTEIPAYPGEIYRIYTCLTVIPLPFCPAHEMLGDVPTIFNQTEGMEGKRFFSFVKEWDKVDRAWTMEFLSLDLYFNGEGKVNPEANASHLVHAWWQSLWHSNSFQWWWSDAVSIKWGRGAVDLGRPLDAPDAFERTCVAPFDIERNSAKKRWRKCLKVILLQMRWPGHRHFRQFCLNYYNYLATRFRSTIGILGNYSWFMIANLVFI